MADILDVPLRDKLPEQPPKGKLDPFHGSVLSQRLECKN